MNALHNEALFDRYIVKAPNGDIPEEIKKWDNIGSLAITQDTKHVGILHKIFYIFQRLHAWLTGRKNVNPDMCHLMIIADRKGIENDSNDLNISHSSMDSEKGVGDVKTARANYLKDPDVTEMIIYVPKDENLRKLLTENAKKTSCCSNNLECSLSKQNKPVNFSIKDLILSFFNNRRKMTQAAKVSAAAKERLAYLVADLLSDRQITEKNGKRLRSFYCVSYVLAILQGCLMINAMTADEIQELKNSDNRDSMAQQILGYINDEDSGHSISEIYRENKICRMDARFIMASYVTKTLDKFSALIA